MAHNEMKLLLEQRKYKVTNTDLANQLAAAYNALRHVSAVAIHLLKTDTVKISKVDFDELLNYADNGASLEIRDVDGVTEIRVVQVPVDPSANTKPESPVVPT